jgi:CubicO group peptidase (beta-lactamase class C family)
MYAAAGYIIELKSGRTWEDFVRKRILKPMETTSTVYTIGGIMMTFSHQMRKYLRGKH